MRATQAVIDLRALVHNLRALRSLCAPSVEVIGVVKADAYGHGAEAASRALASEGVRRFAVAIVEEAITLQEAGIPGSILVLGAFRSDDAEEIAARGFEAVVSDMAFAGRLSDAAHASGRTVPIHLKFDTGMGRFGFMPEKAVETAQRILALPGLSVVGAMTHFAASDEAAHVEFTRDQLRTLMTIRDRLRKAGVAIPLWHAANSAGILGYPEAHLDAVRPGIALYGGIPKYPAPCPVVLKQVMTLKTAVAQIRDLPPGHTVSYGRTFETRRPSRLAVLPIGYADGYDRALSNKGEVLIHGRRAPVAGRVCMDATVADVTDIPAARPGDEVVLCGSQGTETISVDDMAASLGTIPHTVMTGITARVPRVTIS